MKRFAIILALISTAALAQQPQPHPLDVADQMLSTERQASTNLIAVKDGKIKALADERNALVEKLAKAEKEVAACKPKDEKK